MNWRVYWTVGRVAIFSLVMLILELVPFTLAIAGLQGFNFFYAAWILEDPDAACYLVDPYTPNSRLQCADYQQLLALNHLNLFWGALILGIVIFLLGIMAFPYNEKRK